MLEGLIIAAHVCYASKYIHDNGFDKTVIPRAVTSAVICCGAIYMMYRFA